MGQRQNKKPGIIDSAFQITVEASSPYWSVMKYYQTLEKEKARQLLIEAVLGYWGSLASCEFEREIALRRTKKLIAEGIYQLEWQMDFLRCQFNLDESSESKGLRKLVYQTNESVTFDFRYQVASDTGEGLIIEYLMDSKTKISREQKILWSSLAYWGAIADRELSVLPTEQLNWSAANCIYRLSKQIAYLEKCSSLISEEVSPMAPKLPMYPVWMPQMGWKQGICPTNEINGFVNSRRTENGSSVQSSDLDELEDLETPNEEDYLGGNRENDELITRVFDNL